MAAAAPTVKTQPETDNPNTKAAPTPAPPTVPVKPRKEKKRSALPAILGILVALLIVGAGVAIIGFNALGIRDRYLTDILKNIPIVNNLLPAEAVNVPPTVSVEDLQRQITELTNQVGQLTEQNKSLSDKNNIYLQQLEQLQKVEAQQQQFVQDKAQFDEMIALKDPNAYRQFYQSVDPTHAEELYKQVVQISQNMAEVNKYVAAFADMDAGNAAAILEELLTGDLNLVVEILKNTDSTVCGEILAAMTPANAAKVTKRMSPF